VAAWGNHHMSPKVSNSPCNFKSRTASARANCHRKQHNAIARRARRTHTCRITTGGKAPHEAQTSWSGARAFQSRSETVLGGGGVELHRCQEDDHHHAAHRVDDLTPRTQTFLPGRPCAHAADEVEGLGPIQWAWHKAAELDICPTVEVRVDSMRMSLITCDQVHRFSGPSSADEPSHRRHDEPRCDRMEHHAVPSRQENTMCCARLGVRLRTPCRGAP
jgi:hypothetical protein